MEDSNPTLPPLSKLEMQRLARERVSEISKEFADGFKFLEDFPRSVTVFGSTQTKEGSPFYEDARILSGRIVKELGYAILSGGGPGIMEAANRGAFEAGGVSIGLLIGLPQEQIVNKYISKNIKSYYFFVRKVCLSFSAEAFIFYPGGYGTFDEFFEILTLVQTKKITGVPIICVGSKFWNKVVDFMEDEMLARGAIDEHDLDLFHIVDNHDEIIDIIRNAPVRITIPFSTGLTPAEHQAENIEVVAPVEA
jgi:uncharacterized protein (TIGR00730 family)